jgi:predicted enzyme related to lactoylglutathione lyase
MPTLVHFELPADDIERAKKFYTNLFGWNIEKWEGLANNMEYWTINTTDDKGNKGVDGGIKKRMHQGQHITNYVDVKSVDEYSLKIEILGGKIIVPKTPVLGAGYFATCLDTEGNIFGIFEVNTNAK